MHARMLPILVVLLATLAQAAPAPAPADLPTIEQLKQQLAEGKSQEVMRSLAKLTALKGDAAAAYDRYELFMLRGEAALRNKAMPMAAESFASAAKETTDEDKKSIARANEILMRRSKPTGYVSRAPAPRPAPGQKPPGPMPIIDEADRKAAMTALFSDEFTVAQPKLNAAKNATSLTPIADAAKALGDLRALELAAKDSSEKTKSIAAELGDRAHTLISEALRTMQARTEEVWSSASRQTISRDRATGYERINAGLFGMNSTESNDLKGILVTCEKIIPTAQDFATVTGNAGLQTDAEEAQRVYGRAKEVLEYDYANAGRFRMNPPLTNQPPTPNTPK